MLNLAASLAERLIASSWSSPAMEREQGMGADAKGRRELVLRQLQRNCQAVPSQDVQSIVGVLTRSSGR